MQFKIHLWVGLSTITEQEYWQYFDDSHGLAPFCQDVDLSWLDQDFMGYHFDSEQLDLTAIVEETPEPKHHEQMLKDCHHKGITQANVMFYYWGDEPIQVDPNKSYNTLHYIGAYAPT